MRNSSLLGKITVLVVICCCSLSAQGKYGGGSGTAEDPYLIFDANQMNAIGANPGDWDKHFKLMADIDLSWTASVDATSHEVYFGTSSPPPFIRNQTTTTFDPGTMAYGTTYYWCIDEVGAYGKTTGIVWSFTTESGKAHTPDPPDGAMVNGYEEPAGSGHLYVVLSYQPGPTAVKHTGYFSENKANVANRVQDANMGQPPWEEYLLIMYAPGWPDGNDVPPPFNESLVRGTTYFWAIDETDNLGNVFPGDIWEFTVWGFKAFNPDPADKAEYVDRNADVSWGAGFDVRYHDVYFGTDFDDVNNAVCTTAVGGVYKGYQSAGTITYDPGPLEFDTEYFWRIDEVTNRRPFINPCGGDILKGDVWSFWSFMTGSPYWKNQISCPYEPFRVVGTSASEPDWVKFTIFLAPYDPNIVYFQDSQAYTFHYHFATELLDPFIGMSPSEYDQVTLYEQGQQAVLGAVIMPPTALPEYGIQFVRLDPYTREEIAGMFNVVKAGIIADPGVQAFYFPSYEQLATAEANREWFESQGIPLGSTGRWAEGNACYSKGWAIGELKFFAGDQIENAYLAGDLLPGDILLTDGVPAEVPFVAGIITLSASTPNSHVAILAKTYRVPFVHLALAEDANRAQELVGHKIVLRAFDTYMGYPHMGYEVRLIDIEGVLDDATIEEILALKTPPALDISPMAAYGAYSASTEGLLPADIKYFGGKAANFGILRSAIPNKSPVAAAFSFDLWNEFLDQPINRRESVIIEGGGYLLFWADNDEEQGPTHTNFKLDRDGEYVGLYDKDGATLIDGISFGPQDGDVSYGRLPDGNDNWVFFDNGTATPNMPNFGSIGGPTHGLSINEFMADNDTTIEDPDGSGYPDWIELYNAGPNAIELGGMYLTDDANDPTKWIIPFGISSSTLREEISNRLSGHTYPPSNMAALSADLRAIRHIIKSAGITSFTSQQEAAVIATLQDPNYGFDMYRKIRFRSSTNVEDSNQFTGAGLYDSYSGCLADDLDGDSQGPCLCDLDKNNERGVFRAIRKVFASFYNDNAFLERLRHDVNEAEVGMALLVHHSFPDEFELANGVATLEKRGGTSYSMMLVTQDGAVSVANPQDGSIPEEVSVRTYPTLVRQSNLVLLGATVMEWQDEYIELSQLLVAVAEEFERVTGKTKYYVLDFEYKKLSPGGAAIPAGGLVVKQIREIPLPDTTQRITPFLINEPVEFCTFQGECSDVFANHRLKSRWLFETKSLWLTPKNLEDCFYTSVTLEYLAGDRILTVAGAPSLWPRAFHSFDGTDTTVDGWFMHHLANTRDCNLVTFIPTEVRVDEGPMLTLLDIRGLTVGVEYNEPVLSWEWTGSNTTTTDTDMIRLRPCPQPQAGDLLQQCSFEGAKGVSISTSFYWPPRGLGGNTAAIPLSRWVETVIEGYTTEPVVLRGWYSQTYRPEHHNWGAHFLFEPRLEPGISQQILDELRAKDIRLIHFHYSLWGVGDWVTTYGFEDKLFYPADIDGDDDTDLPDFAMFAERWQDTVCDECGGADLTNDGNVDFYDLKAFADNWLAGR